MKQLQFSLSTLFGIVLGFLLLGFAFTPPTKAPPEGNVAPPLNTSSAGQEKQGGLILNTGGAPYGLIVDQGKVGIGTTTPSYSLDVVGDVGWSGSLKVGSVPWGKLSSIPAGFADNTDNTGIAQETDPKVGAVTSGKWCAGDGSKVECDKDAPSTSSPTFTVTDALGNAEYARIRLLALQIL